MQPWHEEARRGGGGGGEGAGGSRIDWHYMQLDGVANAVAVCITDDTSCFPPPLVGALCRASGGGVLEWAGKGGGRGGEVEDRAARRVPTRPCKRDRW